MASAPCKLRLLQLMFPQARQVVVERGNHFLMCDDPDLVAASIRELHHDSAALALIATSEDTRN
jgi:hypothetical protein